MRYFAALLLVILLFCPLSRAAAQDVFLKQHESTIQNPAEPEDRPEENSASPESRPQQTQPMSQKQLANNYYKNCQTKETPLMGPESKKAFCACTAAKIADTMTLENMQAMFGTDTKEAEAQQTRMVALVYVPCMEYPTKDLIEKNCLNSDNIKGSFKRYRAVCSCLADGMAEYTAEKGQRIIGFKMTQNGQNHLDIAGILNTLLESPAFQERSIYYARVCVQKHEFGL